MKRINIKCPATPNPMLLPPQNSHHGISVLWGRKLRSYTCTNNTWKPKKPVKPKGSITRQMLFSHWCMWRGKWIWFRRKQALKTTSKKCYNVGSQYHLSPTQHRSSHQGTEASEMQSTLQRVPTVAQLLAQAGASKARWFFLSPCHNCFLTRQS